MRNRSLPHAPAAVVASRFPAVIVSDAIAHLICRSISGYSPCRRPFTSLLVDFSGLWAFVRPIVFPNERTAETKFPAVHSLSSVRSVSELANELSERCQFLPFTHFPSVSFTTSPSVLNSRSSS